MAKYKQITRAGYEYQDLIGIRELLDFYVNKNLYDYVKLEFSNNGEFESMDDVICKIKNLEKFKLIQVKFTVDGETNQCDWNWLTKKKENGTSLVQKWSKTVLSLLRKNKLFEAKIVTNKLPGSDINSYLENNKINWNLISNEKKSFLIEQLGSENNCKLFLDNCYFEFLSSDLEMLENDLFNKYSSISESRSDWSFLKDFVKNHSISNSDAITHDIFVKITQCHPPKPLSQDFFVPDNYIPPCDKFHTNLVNRIKDNDNCLVITGSPGVGKSTYISYLKSELEKENIYVIRHHYYLSNECKDSKRYKYFDVKSSLLEQINNLFKTNFSCNDELENALNQVANKLNNTQLVIIIDGLDHVWRDTGKKDDLNILFNNLFPLPNNIKLLIGTQPVDSEKLPHKLLEIEQDKWLELPLMSPTAIKNYLENNPRIQVPEGYHSDYYADISNAFFKLTNGHPLHLIYSLEYALNNLSRLFPYDIERLPNCPNNDIREYYKNLLSTIDDYAKQILYIFVISEIELWKKNGIEECLTCNGITDVTKFYKQIQHILFDNGYFIKTFHESIFVFIKEKISEDDKIKYLKYVQKWINEQANPIYSDLYLPIIDAKLGMFSKVLNISKSQILEYFQKGYSLNLIAQFLSKAEQITFFELKDFIKTTEIRHLKTRILNLLDFNTYEGELFCSLHFNLYKNNDSINHLKSSISTLSVDKLVALSDFCRDNDKQIDEILKQIRLRHKLVSHDSKIEDAHFLHVYANSSKIEAIKQYLIKNQHSGGLLVLFKHIYIQGKIDIIENYISNEINDYSIIRMLCLYAIKQQIDLSNWTLPESYIKNPYLAFELYLKNKTQKENVYSLSNEIVHKRKSDYDYSGRCLDLENYFHSLFFENLYNKLTNNVGDNRIETYNGFENFITILQECSNKIAVKIKNNQKIDLSYLLSLFESFSESQIIDEDRWKSKYRVSKSTITKIVFDLLILLGIKNDHLQEQDLRQILAFKHFHEDFWIEDYIENGIIYLSNDAVKFYLNKHQELLNKTLQYTQERTDKYLILSKFSRIHGLINEAKIFLDKAFMMAMGYNHHKDPTILYVVNALEYCLANKDIDCKNALMKLIKIINGIADFTDGDETSWTKVSLMKLLFNYSKEWAIKYYGHLLKKEDWYYADECLKIILENLDYVDINTQILLSTIVSDIPFLDINQNLDSVHKHKNLVGRYKLKSKDYSSSLGNITNKESIKFNYEDYPVEKLDEFLLKIDYSNEYCISEWLEHWKNKGYNNEILNYFNDLYISKKHNFIRNIALESLSKMALDTLGKDAAYIWFSRFIVENLSWNRYFSGCGYDKSKEYLRNISEIYPKKWEDIIIDSSENKYDTEDGNDFIIGSDNLIYFLIANKQTKLAENLLNKLVDLLELDMADLPLKEVDWL